jgi:hypothetical protein
VRPDRISRRATDEERHRDDSERQPGKSVCDEEIVRRKNAPAVSVLCFRSQRVATSIFSRSDSRIQRERTSDRAKVARMTRPVVAAPAATTAKTNGLPSGMLNPTHDIAIHVGGANAGMRFSRRISRKSTASVSTISTPGHPVSRLDFAEERSRPLDSRQATCRARSPREALPRDPCQRSKRGVF